MTWCTILYIYLNELTNRRVDDEVRPGVNDTIVLFSGSIIIPKLKLNRQKFAEPHKIFYFLLITLISLMVWWQGRGTHLCVTHTKKNLKRFSGNENFSKTNKIAHSFSFPIIIIRQNRLIITKNKKQPTRTLKMKTYTYRNKSQDKSNKNITDTQLINYGESNKLVGWDFDRSRMFDGRIFSLSRIFAYSHLTSTFITLNICVTIGKKRRNKQQV